MSYCHNLLLDYDFDHEAFAAAGDCLRGHLKAFLN